MWVFVDKNTAAVVAYSGRTEVMGELGHPPLEVALAAAEQETGLGAKELLPYAVTDKAEAARIGLAWGNLVATIAGGQVVSIAPAPAPPSPTVLMLDVALTGGDGMDPPGLDVQANPPQELVATATLRGPTGKPVPLTDEHGWRMAIYHQDGRIALIASVGMTGGVATCRIPSNHPLLPMGVFIIDDRDFEPITMGGQPYVVKMPEPAKFKAYIKLSN